MFCDPQSDREVQGQPHKTVYRSLRHAGLTVHSAARRKKVVPRRAAVELVNRLLCNEAGERRLFVAVDSTGQPSAPKLVEAFETQQTGLDGNPEPDAPKDETDLSHWPAAL